VAAPSRKRREATLAAKTGGAGQEKFRSLETIHGIESETKNSRVGPDAHREREDRDDREDGTFEHLIEPCTSQIQPSPESGSRDHFERIFKGVFLNLGELGTLFHCSGVST